MDDTTVDRELAYDQHGELYRDRFRAQMLAATELINDLERLRAERDALAAELDTERHEFDLEPINGLCRVCYTIPSYDDGDIHRTARVVLAEQAEK